MEALKFSILMPAYNGADFIAQTLNSILSQGFTDYEIVIIDDHSSDGTSDVVNSFKDGRIRFYKNSANLGYPANLRECSRRADGDIIYLMGQDDILGKDALADTFRAFNLSPDIGAVTRPYYWFDAAIDKPVRAKKQLSPVRDEIVSIDDDVQRVIAVYHTLDQLSGLALRKKYIDADFHQDIFPCHAYPFASIFKKHSVVFLKDYNIAVRIRSSQCRNLSSIYDKSPLQSWVDMFNSVFSEERYKNIKKYCIKNFAAVNYVGLVQIRNYARYRYLWREIMLLIKYRWQNIFSPQFWFFSLGTIIMPPALLIPLVDWFKNRVNSKRFAHIKLKV